MGSYKSIQVIMNGNDYLYYLKEKNIYLMYDHRFSLWAWLNEIKAEEFGKFNLVHIDTHHDCGEACFGEEQIITKDNINEFKNLEIFSNAKCANNKNLELFNCGSFLGNALKSNLFKKIYFFVRSDNISISYKECFDGINPISSYVTEIEYEENENLKKLKNVLENNKDIFLDLDLDYFVSKVGDKSDIFNEEKLFQYFKIIKDNIENIKVITVAETNRAYSDLKIKFLKYFGIWDEYIRDNKKVLI